MKWMFKRAVFLGTLGLVAGGAVGCAQEREPVNQVQRDALTKSFFVGPKLNDSADDPEFWAQGTLIDVGYGAAQDGLFTSTYAQPVSRIKWQITEKLLIGRLAYERIEGADGKGFGPASNDGVIAYVYPILSHFDIRRDYNRATGEESNVIVENTTDRPWDQREYMRVDWSINDNPDAYDFDTLSMVGVFGSVEYEPLHYYVNNPKDPDAPYFDAKEGYFDITNKALAKPKLIDLSHLGWGIDKYPACFLDNDFMGGSAPAGNCNPVELTIRQSFRRVVEKDYEPVEWDGYRFQAYGGFYVERSGYARNYGMSDDKWHRLLNRYNIWERSHFYADPANMQGEIKCFTPETTPVGGDPHRDVVASDGSLVPDGTEDECAAAGAGSTCDTFRQRCTLPYRQRTAVPVVWYYTNTSDPNYFEGTDWATHEWDVAMRVAVQSAKYSECMRVRNEVPPGADLPTAQATCASLYPLYFGQQEDNEDAIAVAKEVDDCRAMRTFPERNGQGCEDLADTVGMARGVTPGVVAIAKMPEMLVLCHSPVLPSDNALCGERGLTVRQGDLRYHQVNVISTPQTPSPWGIYTDSEDPLTGEKIAASINVWSYVTDLFSQGLVDQVRYIKGELKTADVTEGTYVHDWAQASEAASGKGVLPLMSRQQLDRKLDEAMGIAPHQDSEIDLHGVKLRDPAVEAQVELMHKKVKTIRADATAQPTSRAIYDARRRQAVGTEFEAKLVTAPMLQLTGTDNLPLTEETMNIASPLRGANPSVQRDMRQLKELALADRGMCIMHEAPAPLAIADLGNVLEQKFAPFNPSDPKDVQVARAERMRQYLAQRAHYAVIIHEMGHSVGERHNFLSSAKASGYRPQYWQLRTKDGTVTAECSDLKTAAEAENCAGPRYFDPITDHERNNLLWMFMQSSVMDYAGEVTQDLIGLGAYDFAAVRMFYGQNIAVHADDDYHADQPLGLASLEITDGFGGIIGMQYTKNGGSQPEDIIHYSQLQKVYKLIDPASCHPVNPDAFRPASWNAERDGNFHPLLDGLLVDGKGTGEYTRCRGRQVDYVPWTAMTNVGEGFLLRSHSIDPNNRTRVPYAFATDRWADIGNLSVYRHDNGADPYELFNYFITQQEVGHIFDNYRRNRHSFSIRASADRRLTRYNAKMRDGAKGLGLLANIYRVFEQEIGQNYDTAWPQVAALFYPENMLASGVAFDHFTRQLSRPQVGPHYRPTGDPIFRSADATYAAPGPTLVNIPNGATGYYGDVGVGGMLVENRLSENHGEYDAEYTVNCGSYYDKLNTSMLMTESVDNFISDSLLDFVDARLRSVSLADLFPDGYRRWLGNNLTDDEFIKGVRLPADKPYPLGKPILDVAGGEKFPASGIAWTSWWPTSGPEACFPGNGSTVCTSFDNKGGLDPQPIPDYAVIDPQVGWEQQKFLIAWTLMYLPENQHQNWLNMMRIWEIGDDTNPAFTNRIELHDPAGKVYVAKTYGKESIFGKSVQKGIAARVLEYANELMFAAYETTPGADLDGDSTPDWYVPVLNSQGQPIVKYDPTISANPPGCNAMDNSGCTCTSSRACTALQKYVEIPFFLRQAVGAYRLADPSQKGLWD